MFAAFDFDKSRQIYFADGHIRWRFIYGGYTEYTIIYLSIE